MKRQTRSGIVTIVVFGSSVLGAVDISAQTRVNSCIACHTSLPQTHLSEPPMKVAGDVHDKANVRCSDCHGGDPAAAVKAAAHDPAHGYKGKLGATICASCHELFAERFASSPHAPIFERSCVECHGNHGIETASDAMVGTSKGTLCLTCHSEKDDPGFVGADRMGRRLATFNHELDAGTTLIDRVRNAGMEVGDQELKLVEARSKLTFARTELHAFNPASFDAVVEDGLQIVLAANDGGNRALMELGYRRRGLYVSLGAILLMVIALVLKIRDLDRRHHPL